MSCMSFSNFSFELVRYFHYVHMKPSSESEKQQHDRHVLVLFAKSVTSKNVEIT